MKCSLLSIGCNDYFDIHLDNLSCAENDASVVFSALVESEYSMYSEGSSVLLKSSNAAAVHTALKKILFDNTCPDVLTIFFAGHGGVYKGSYYLFMADADVNKISVTALPLSELFRIASSSDIKHLNIVIDACNAAGLVNDLIGLIKPELIGAKGSYGVSILAAAASNEYATEEGDHGLLTGRLVSILLGHQYVNAHSEYLDLVHIGRAISAKFAEDGIDQTPSSWGINLYGPSIFARNPFHSADDAIPTHFFSFIPPASRIGRTLFDYRSELWDIYENLESKEGVQEILRVLRSLVGITKNVDDLITIVKGVGYRFIEKLDSVPDFKQLEIINSLATLIIPHATDAKVIELLSELMELFQYYARGLLRNLNEKLASDKYHLITKGAMAFDILANFYYLPIRISKMLGYFSQLIMIDESAIGDFKRFLSLIEENYGNHLSVVSNIQAPYLYIFFKVVSDKGQSDIAMPALVSYIASYMHYSERIAADDLSAEDVCYFFLQRHTKAEVNAEYKANTSSVGAALLLVASWYKLNDELDSRLHILDRCSMHVFIPKFLHEYGDESIENGINLMPRCGFDFWTCSDFENLINQVYIGNSTIDRQGLTIDHAFSCVAASFSQPDRLPLMC